MTTSVRTARRPTSPTTPPTAQLLVAYADAVRATFGAEHLEAPWCIRATRTALLAFEAFGRRVEPATVYLQCCNPAASALAGVYRGPVQRGQRPVVVPCGMADLARAPKQAGIWDGHLVALVDGRHLVDAAVAQCRRPHAGIDTPDVLVALNVALTVGGRSRAVRVPSSPSGAEFTHVIYTRLPRDPRAFEFGAWLSPANRRNAERVVAHMRTSLDVRAG